MTASWLTFRAPKRLPVSAIRRNHSFSSTQHSLSRILGKLHLTRYSPARHRTVLGRNLSFLLNASYYSTSTVLCTSVFFPMPDDVRTLLPVDHREPVAGLRSLHMHRRWRRFTQLHHVSIPSKGEAPTPRAKLPQKKSSSAAVPRSRRALH